MKTVGDTQYVGLSEVKSALPKIVGDLHRHTVLMRRNEPVAALVSIEQYNKYLALEKLLRHPEIFDRLRSQAREAAKTPIASLRTMEDLKALHKKLLKPKQTSAAPTRASRR